MVSLKDKIKVFLMQHPYVCFFSTFIGMPIVALVITFLFIVAIMLPISYFMG